MKYAVLLCAAVLLSGCAAGHLYPVRGALAARTPPPVYKVKMDSADSISTRLANGEVCSGTWLNVVQEDPTSRDMAADWDIVYGNGFFQANVQGKIAIARAVLSCPNGESVKVEFNSTKGVAADNNGDVFRLTF